MDLDFLEWCDLAAVCFLCWLAFMVVAHVIVFFDRFVRWAFGVGENSVIEISWRQLPARWWRRSPDDGRFR